MEVSLSPAISKGEGEKEAIYSADPVSDTTMMPQGIKADPQKMLAGLALNAYPFSTRIDIWICYFARPNFFS